MKDPIYLGDSVYYDNDGYYVNLYLNNGLGPHNCISMEPEVIQAFLLKLDQDGILYEVIKEKYEIRK